MTRRPNAALVGAFVILGALLVVFAVIFWGAGRIFERKYRYICYFPGSVNGLTVGAPVKYRGVTIGHVQDMLIPYSVSADVRVAVVIDLEGRKVRKRGGDVDPTEDIIRAFIARGMRARLQSESFITGQLIVTLDIVESAPPVPFRYGREGLLEIPTLPSETEQLRNLITAVGQQLRATDLPRLATSATEAFEAVAGLAHAPELRRTLNELSLTAAELRRLTTATGARLEPTAGLLADLRATLAPEGPLMTDLSRTLGELSRAAASIRVLADFLERNPNALLVGKKQ